MVTLRVAKVNVEPNHKLRVAKVTLQGGATNPKLRVAKVTVQGGVTLIIRPIPDQLVEALATTVITVPGLANFPAFTTFSWRQMSGPTVTFSDNGSSVSFTAPPAMGGTSVVFGVTAQNGGQSSAEATGTVNVIPHVYWSAGVTAWIPTTRRATA